MPIHRHHLPQLTDAGFLTDGGIETTLIYDDGFALPDFVISFTVETDLADRYRRLRHRHPQLRVLGGCCGTNHHHIDASADACVMAVRS